MRVLVVGGGIIGCATAYELAKAGAGVVLFERSTPGAEASSAAAGLLALHGEPAQSELARLKLASWRLYPDVVRELRELTGIDVEHVTHGTLYPLARGEAAPAPPADGPDLGIEVLEGKDLHGLEPALSPRIERAVFLRDDHWLNNQRLVIAYAQAAARVGVEIRPGSNVSRVLVEAGRARAVEADGERVSGDAVLLAAGAWTSELTAPLGVGLTIEPRRGQMLALAHTPPVLTYCVDGEVYLVPRPSGELLIGATVERAGFQRAVTAEGIQSLLQRALELVPSLAGLPIARTWCGFRPWAPDGLPVLGPWPGIEGLWLATGHFRNGILLAPITARLMTDWLTTGKPSVEVGDFLPERFARR